MFAEQVKGSPLGSTFQAMVSVMAVKIQLSSPSGVRLSFSLPGILEHTTQHRWLHVSVLTQNKRGLGSGVFTTTNLETFTPINTSHSHWLPVSARSKLEENSWRSSKASNYN